MVDMTYYVQIKNEDIIAKSKVKSLLTEEQAPSDILIVDEVTFNAIRLPAKVVMINNNISFENIEVKKEVIAKDYTEVITGLEQAVIHLADINLALDSVQPLTLNGTDTDDIREKINEILNTIKGGPSIV